MYREKSPGATLNAVNRSDLWKSNKYQRVENLKPKQTGNRVKYGIQCGIQCDQYGIQSVQCGIHCDIWNSRSNVVFTVIYGIVGPMWYSL